MPLFLLSHDNTSSKTISHDTMIYPLNVSDTSLDPFLIFCLCESEFTNFKINLFLDSF